MILLINIITLFIELLKWNLFKLRMIIMLNIMNMHLIKKILNLKLVTLLEFLNIKRFLLKDIIQIGQKKFLLLMKLKIQVIGLMLLVIWMVKKLLEVFVKKNCKKTNQKEFRIEKVLKRKSDKLYDKWKGYNNSFSSWLIKKISYKNKSTHS